MCGSQSLSCKDTCGAPGCNRCGFTEAKNKLKRQNELPIPDDYYDSLGESGNNNVNNNNGNNDECKQSFNSLSMVLEELSNTFNSQFTDKALELVKPLEKVIYF